MKRETQFYDFFLSQTSPGPLKNWLQGHRSPVERTIHSLLASEYARGKEIAQEMAALHQLHLKGKTWVEMLGDAGFMDTQGVYQVCLVPVFEAVNRKIKNKHELDEELCLSAIARVYRRLCLRERDELHDMLHPGNKFTMSVFKVLTGYEATRSGVDAWFDSVGMGDWIKQQDEAERRKKEQDEIAAKTQHELDKRQRKQDATDKVLDKIWNTSRWGNISGRDLIKSCVQDGCDQLIPERDGLITVWRLTGDDVEYSYMLRSIVEARYAAEQIERTTGKKIVVQNLPKITVIKHNSYHTAFRTDLHLPRGFVPSGAELCYYNCDNWVETQKEAIEQLEKKQRELIDQGVHVVNCALIIWMGTSSTAKRFGFYFAEVHP